VGGLHPELSLDWYCEMISGLRERYPHVHLKAFTMVEVGYLARRAKLSIEETLIKLKDAGVQSLPGGGAEIFSERVRRIICDHKIDGNEWIETARIAHRVGLKSNCTMLYGHIETAADRVDHLLRLRALQDDTGGFQTFIPLAFHPENTPMRHLRATTGFEDIKNIAVARLMLDNIPHIKAYWIMMTPKIAQVAQRFGADDMDGTVVEEKIYHDAGATTSQSLRREELLRLIRRAGREPVERDTLYRPVERDEAQATFTVLV
jgi:aminodeoxyfutalosine synthase